MRSKVPKKKPVRVKSVSVSPWLVDVPVEHVR